MSKCEIIFELHKPARRNYRPIVNVYEKIIYGRQTWLKCCSMQKIIKVSSIFYES